MSVTGERDGEPTKAGVALLDVITGLYAAVGVLAALRERDITGRGRHVSVALFDASVAAMVNQAANYLIGGVVPQRMGTAHPNIVPYQAFHASDRPFILAAGNDRLFARTCQVVEHADWADDPRFVTNEWAWAYTLDKLAARGMVDENGNPDNYGAAVAIYKPSAPDTWSPFNLAVLEIENDEIVGITNFLYPELFEAFGLPATLTAPSSTA